VSAEIGTTAAVTWSTDFGFGATSTVRATQNSACAPSPNQSFMPNTASPTATSFTPGPSPFTSPENSCPGMIGNGRASPARVVQVGTHSSSVGVTAAARTRTRTSPAPGRGTAAGPYASASGPPRELSWIAFI
jgi:hypothetical protein